MIFAYIAYIAYIAYRASNTIHSQFLCISDLLQMFQYCDKKKYKEKYFTNKYEPKLNIIQKQNKIQK